jgi:hypothetical protein
MTVQVVRRIEAPAVLAMQVRAVRLMTAPVVQLTADRADRCRERPVAPHMTVPADLHIAVRAGLATPDRGERAILVPVEMAVHAQRFVAEWPA